MPQSFKERQQEEIIKRDSLKLDIKVDTVRGFSTIEVRESLSRLGIIYDVDDRIGFVLRLIRNGIRDRSYHVAIVSELKKLLDDLKRMQSFPDINRELLDKTILDIERLIKVNSWPIGYEEVMKSLSEFRVKMYNLEEKSLSVINEQFRRLLGEYPDLYPDVPIKYTSSDEDMVRSVSLSEFGQMIEMCYSILKNLEMKKYDNVRSEMLRLRELMNLFSEDESEDPKNIIGYAKHLLSLFSKASDQQLERGKNVIRTSIVFQVVIRLFVIRLKIDYPGDGDRVRTRQEFYRSK
ncbi:MAG: hypothetical protein NZ908_02760 [Candidatus Micrarchaeota archaeon]|nr:hypothetical protein [Candidatus Micrarchaeota archaeon]